MKFWIRLIVGPARRALIAWLAIPVAAFRAPRPEWKVVGEADNAWLEYHQLGPGADLTPTLVDAQISPRASLVHFEVQQAPWTF